tara:strand:+ start:198 stop:869 length:672 start_codon:yes stop_codon:yes gene_type:complete
MKNEVLKRILSSLTIIPISFFFIIKGSVFFAFFLAIFFLATSYEWVKMNKNNIVKLIGVIFLLSSSYSAYLLREGTSNDLNIFLFVMIICIFTDIGGYIFGKLFKGPKLIKISPNKTYSGMIGSFILSVVAAKLFIENSFVLTSHITIFEFGFFMSNDFNLLLVILFISSISQIGDLVVSYFKRLSKVKNTGNLIPGHGGLLDRVDGIIFAIPISYILFRILT